jgi:hypothetical protein
VEVTVLGEGSFAKAWNLGAQATTRLAQAGGVENHWRAGGLAPVPLRDFRERSRDKSSGSEAVEGDLLSGLAGLQKLREAYVEETYIKSLLANPDDHELRIALAKTLI